MRNLLPVGLACVVLSGCNAMQNARTEMKPNTIFGPEHSNQMYLGRCNERSEYKDGTCEVDQRFVDSRASFRQASLDASKQAMDGLNGAELKPLVQRYIHSGVAVADLYCETFFRQISTSAAHRKFLRSETNAVGGMATAIMSATNASAAVVGSSSALFTLLDSTGEHYDASYLVAPDLSRVEKLLEKTQDEYLTTYGSAIEDFYLAQRFLVRYSNNCTFNGLRTLVNQSVDTAQPSTDKKTGTQALNEVGVGKKEGNSDAYLDADGGKK